MSTGAEMPIGTAVPTVVFQPIISVATGHLFAVEALARFGADTSAEHVIAEARRRGSGIEVELACMHAARRRMPDLPPGVKMSVNVSPDVLEVVARYPDDWPQELTEVIVEVTEQAAGSPDELGRQVAPLRERGAQVAVDDVGTGYAGLLRLASMRPDFVKIDKSIVTGVRDSIAQSAVLESLVAFSHRIGATVIAEGVESIEDLSALGEFDVDYAQGWLIGRPDVDTKPIDEDVVQMCRRARAGVLASARDIDSPARRAGAARTMHEATSLMSLANEFAQLRDAVDHAASAVDVDIVGLSVLSGDGRLRELISAGTDLDTNAYALLDYPSSRTAMATGETVEVHIDDEDGDEAEQQVMRAVGAASLLIVPFGTPGDRVGILEFFSRRHRRWTTFDIEQGRGLALHVGSAWARLAISTTWRDALEVVGSGGRANRRRPRPGRGVGQA